MKFSEKKILRDCESIFKWRRECFRTDLDPLYADEVYELFKECCEAAMAHPDWDSDGERAFCVNPRSHQKTPKKLLRWYRARRGYPTTPEPQYEK